MNLSIHYTYNQPYPISYSMQYQDHIWLSIDHLWYVTPEVLQGHIQYLTTELVDLEFCRRIVSYPEHYEVLKDVTVVFCTQ